MAIDLGRQRPGAQPGRWRLNMGRCAVGELALSRTPQQVRTRERQERGGPQAKNVDLKTNTGGGRNRDRVRRQHRECHKAIIVKYEDLKLSQAEKFQQISMQLRPQVKRHTMTTSHFLEMFFARQNNAYAYVLIDVFSQTEKCEQISMQFRPQAKRHTMTTSHYLEMFCCQTKQCICLCFGRCFHTKGEMRLN